MSRWRLLWATALARVVFSLAGLVLHLSDKTLLRLIRLIELLPGVKRGPLGQQLREVADVLGRGEPYSTILRDMVFKAERRRALCTIRGAFLYGKGDGA